MISVLLHPMWHRYPRSHDCWKQTKLISIGDHHVMQLPQDGRWLWRTQKRGYYVDSPLCGTMLVAISASSPINSEGFGCCGQYQFNSSNMNGSWREIAVIRVSKCAESRRHAHFLTDCELVFTVDRRLCRGHLCLPFGLVRFCSFFVLNLIVNIFYLSI